MKIINRIKFIYVKYIYGDHNLRSSVRKPLQKLIKDLPSDGVGLNIGAGQTMFNNKILNLDIEKKENINLVGSVEKIPSKDSRFDLLICQEVLEHVENPYVALREMHRVLKPSGKLFLQVPFIIGYHPCPNDYWRFTNEGLKYIVEKNKFKILYFGETVGSATGFYRVSVEFFSILFSIIFPFMYKPFKAFFALIFYPIKYLDHLIKYSPEKLRISGGSFVVCQKVI